MTFVDKMENRKLADYENPTNLCGKILSFILGSICKGQIERLFNTCYTTEYPIHDYAFK